MKASRCSTACVARTFTLLTAALLLVQCSMPPQESWRYIQTNGLFSYWNASPPFHTGGSQSPRFLASAQQRSTPAWRSSSGLQNRMRYGAANVPSYSPNSYLAQPSSGSSGSRYIPRSRSDSPSHHKSPAVKMPVDEPASAPHVAHGTPPASSAPKSSDTPAPAPSTESLPYGSAVPGRMNMVNSPYAGKTQLVDVSGMSAGQTVKCPYTGKLFKVPPTQQAANHAEPRLESKAEPSKSAEEPKAGDKKP